MHRSCDTSSSVVQLAADLEREFTNKLKGELAKGRAAPVARLLVETAVKLIGPAIDEQRQATFAMVADALKEHRNGAHEISDVDEH